MNTETITLLSALIAAVASVGGLLLKASSDSQTELRAVKRKTLEPHISGLGTALHEIVATSNILMHPAKEKARPKWVERSKKAQGALKTLRPQVRYALWGAEDSLRSLSYLPDWVSRQAANLENTRGLIKQATLLRMALDGVIQRCYDEGRTPTVMERWWLKFRNYRFLKVWGKTKDVFFGESEDVDAQG